MLTNDLIVHDIPSSQVSLRYYPICIQQMDVFTAISRISLPSLCNDIAYGCPVGIGGAGSASLAQDV
jgi:hypothetical protein